MTHGDSLGEKCNRWARFGIAPGKRRSNLGYGVPGSMNRSGAGRFGIPNLIGKLATFPAFRIRFFGLMGNDAVGLRGKRPPAALAHLSQCLGLVPFVQPLQIVRIHAQDRNWHEVSKQWGVHPKYERCRLQLPRRLGSRSAPISYIPAGTPVAPFASALSRCRGG